MEPLKKDEMQLTPAELRAIVAKHFGVDPEQHVLRPRYRFMQGEFGPPEDRMSGIAFGIGEIVLEPVSQAS